MASSSSRSPHSTYDVFLSFRGEDTRKNFTDHLYNTLIAYGIRTFRDDEQLQKGDDIKSGLSTAIQVSNIFLIIFSENYATSKWCLDELVKIIECTTRTGNDDDDQGKRVIPVFYHVEPRDVGHQSGSFQDAFLNHEKDANQEKMELIGKWRIALQKAAKLSGHHVDNQYEAEIIEKIREVIIRRLNRKPLHVGDNIVGMDFHLEQLKSRMKIKEDGVCMVGVCMVGIYGIGKTTMAMAIYNDISSQFDGSSFLRVESNSDLLQLQKKLLRDILKVQSVEIYDPSEGISVIKERLSSKRVLIVLDNVDSIDQFNNLAGKDGWYGAKSIVILTTKDINLLNQLGANHFYEVKGLNHEDAIELFNWAAFKKNIPRSKDFEDLSYSVVKYCKGLPLALKVIGGFLCDKNIDEWKSELKKLEKIPNIKVHNILRVSYDKLDDVDQGIFLDIACFFRGEDKDFVSSILGSHAIIGITVLQQRCLITIIENKLDIHDLLQQMGREIVRKERPNEPGARSRLWDPEDVQKVLTRNLGTNSIEGLYFEIPGSCQIQISRDSFTRMTELRLLKVHPKFWNNFKLHLPTDFELSSYELRYLYFSNYPLESLPTNFNASNLVELHLPYSKIKKLCEKNKDFDNLKVIDLQYSYDLVEMPDCARMKNLESLNLTECRSLESLPRNFDKLQHLQSLNCAACSKLKSFPQIEGNMSKLRNIDLSWTAIVEVPSSIGLLDGLESLNLSGCRSLESLPRNFDKLQHVQSLNCAWCWKLKSFPQIEGNMSKLREIDLSYTAIVEVPSSIGHLKALQSLKLSGCRNLENLPDSICDLRSLEKLDVLNCSKLEKLKVQANENELLTCVILKPGLGVVWRDDLLSFKTLNLQYCNQMEAEAPNSSNHHHHLLSLSSLVELSVRKSTDGFHFSSLKVVSEGNFNPMMTRGIFNDIFLQSSLRRLTLCNCNLMDERIIPTKSWNLSSLVNLSLSNCNLREGDILNHICHLSSLEQLSLEGNHFSSIPASINQLSNLKGLNLSHCKQLQDIPELPSTLLFLDAHCSDGISSSPSLLSLHSQFNRFVSKLTQETDVRVGASQFRGMGMSIVIPRSSTILEMVRNPSMRSDQVTIRLPRNWYENNDFWGFAICCVCVLKSVDDEDKEEDEGAVNVECHLTISRNNQSKTIERLSFRSWCASCEDSGLSDQILWVIYYPKDAIKEECRSNEWTHLTASFCCCGRCCNVFHKGGCEFFRARKWNGTGFHLIYSEEHQQSQDDDDDDENNNRSTTEDAKRRRHDEEHYQSEE